MMEPAQTVIQKLGGATSVSKVVGIHRSRVSSWRLPKSKGGTDGTVPQRHHRSLLEYAQSNNIDLRAEDFLPRGDAPALTDTPQTAVEPERAGQ